MVDAADLKSASLYREWGFESLPGHQFTDCYTWVTTKAEQRPMLATDSHIDSHQEPQPC